MVFLLVPMFLALIQSRKHDWQDCGRVIANQTKDVLVIPEIQSSLSHLLVKLHKKKKKIVKNPKQEHLRNQSISKQSYKRNTRQKKNLVSSATCKRKNKTLSGYSLYNGLLQKKKKKRYSMLVTKQVVRKSSAEKRNKKETNSCRMSRSHDAHDESTKRNS